MSTVEGGAGDEQMRDLLLGAAMALHYVDDLPIAEVAEVLDTSQANIRTLLARGRALLAPMLAEDEPAGCGL